MLKYGSLLCTYPCFFGLICASIMAPNISTHPRISLGLSVSPSNIYPASTETTDSRLSIREAMVGSVPR